MGTYSSSRVKKRAFIEKVNSRCFCWFPAAILVHQNGTPIWRLHTKLYKGAWNVSANNSETVCHKDLRLDLRQIVYKLVFYNIWFSWLLRLDGFQFIFLLRDCENDLYWRKYQRSKTAKLLGGKKVNESRAHIIFEFLKENFSETIPHIELKFSLITVMWTVIVMPFQYSEILLH